MTFPNQVYHGPFRKSRKEIDAAYWFAEEEYDEPDLTWLKGNLDEFGQLSPKAHVQYHAMGVEHYSDYETRSQVEAKVKDTTESGSWDKRVAAEKKKLTKPVAKLPKSEAKPPKSEAKPLKPKASLQERLNRERERKQQIELQIELQRASVCANCGKRGKITGHSWCRRYARVDRGRATLGNRGKVTLDLSSVPGRILADFYDRKGIPYESTAPASERNMPPKDTSEDKWAYAAEKGLL